MAEAIFCQACFDATHEVQKSIHIVNTNGSCGKCGSMQVLDPAKLASGLVRKPDPLPVKPSAYWLKEQQPTVKFLERHYPEIAKWWDGWDSEVRFESEDGDSLTLIFTNNGGEKKKVEIYHGGNAHGEQKRNPS